MWLNMIINPHVKAEIKYLSMSEGGRRTAAKSGYRGQFHYKNQNHEGWDAVQDFIGKDWVEPGETISVDIAFASHEVHANKIIEGM